MTYLINCSVVILLVSYRTSSWFQGALFLRGRRKKGRGRREGKRGEKERNGSGREGREIEGTPPNANSWISPGPCGSGKTFLFPSMFPLIIPVCNARVDLGEPFPKIAFNFSPFSVTFASSVSKSNTKRFKCANTNTTRFVISAVMPSLVATFYFGNHTCTQTLFCSCVAIVIIEVT